MVRQAVHVRGIYGLAGSGVFEYPPEWELFDLDTDPHELRNVYDDPAYAQIREELKVKLYAAQAAVGDEPATNDQPAQDERASVLARFTGSSDRNPVVPAGRK
ncbi:sulfatase/phosphatase domain-containing protein [Kribbella sp. NBC_00889]|uniref:sulfatase/phosphatase domain-containing protein n=1 Tax=Kribbella sp. NBC_00889 TaxID=2975974 RepID=UPI00386F8FB1|nr:DUF4976 domain-containing protein [Kribbella sp. NBC_00889]